jgi:hypothetical protein
MARGGRKLTHPGIGENWRRNPAAGGGGGGAVHLPFVDVATTGHAGAGAEAAGYLSHGDDGDCHWKVCTGRGEPPAATQNHVVW